jgi:mannose-6-phosphate isomerase-like protein (cupin superfamily)
MTINLNGIEIQPGQHPCYWVLGDLYTFKALGEDTEQLYALIEILVQPQSGTPLHIHHNENESFYILEGEVEFQLDDQIMVATSGNFLHSPKGQLHRLTNIGAAPARMLCWLTPAGLEKLFMEVGQPVQDFSAAPPAVSAADIEKLIAEAPKYGLTIIPPA